MSEQESFTPEEIEEQERRLKEAAAQAGEVCAQELAIEQEPIAPIREVQADLLADMGNRFKGKSIEDLQKMLNDPKELDAFGRDNLPGRETQAADVVQNLIRERGESEQEHVTLETSMADKPMRQQKEDAAWGARFDADEERKQARRQQEQGAAEREVIPEEEGGQGTGASDALASAREKLAKFDELTQEAKRRTGSENPAVRVPPELLLNDQELAALQEEGRRQGVEGGPSTLDKDVEYAERFWAEHPPGMREVMMENLQRYEEVYGAFKHLVSPSGIDEK